MKASRADHLVRIWMMSQSSAERLKAYLTQLPPQAQALLIREFERSLERGDDAAVASFVLGELRKIVRAPDENLSPRYNDPARLLFQPLEPFLTDTDGTVGPGEIHRNSLALVWNWVAREGAPDAARAFVSAVASAQGKDLVSVARMFRMTVSECIQTMLTGPDSRRALARIAQASALDDLPSIAAVLASADTLDAFAAKLPGHFRAFDDSHIASVTAMMGPALQTPHLLPFAFRIAMARLSAPWQIIRMATRAAFTDDAVRVAAHPYGVAVTIVIQGLSQIVATLRADIKRGQFGNAGDLVKAVHDGVRGLRTELDIRKDTPWGKQLALLRVDMSDTLKFEIDSVPGRVRRLLRQRADRDVTATSRLDPVEIEETAALIDFVAMCRSFASELAINEVTLRTYSDLQSYIETSTESLVKSLRQCDPVVRPFRQQQAQAAIRFCEVMFGRDYATLMSRAADNALADERKPVRAG
ncbi:MAG: hypothetical protein JWP21_1115 [Tardiphaga sp.]|nr:hypothetical protein [Tardiphaga sp.]